jgi:hypothetical protein
MQFARDNMPDRYGYSEPEWESGKAEMSRILRERASKGGTEGLITYGELSQKLTSIKIGHHDNAMGAMLGQISTEEDACGRGMLSVIVVRKHGDKQPGKGFYECAAELGRDVTDRDRMWVDELKRVYAESVKTN